MRDSIDQGLAHLGSSQRSAEAVAAVLASASDSVAEVDAGLNRIATAAEEQRRASAAVAANIESIASMARGNSEAVQHTVTAAQALQSLADELHQTVGRFKT